MTGEVAQGAKTETVIRKKKNLNLIAVKIKTRATSLTRNIKRTQKEKMVRELEQSQKARREQPQKMDIDRVAKTGIDMDLHRQKTKKKNERKMERGAGNIAGVRKDNAPMKERTRGEEHPGIGNVVQEVQTGIGLKTLTEAGAPEVRVITARTNHLTEKTKQLPVKGEDVAAAPTVTEMRKVEVERDQSLKQDQKVNLNLKTEEVQIDPDQDQIVQKAKTERTDRGTNRVQAPALTATDP